MRPTIIPDPVRRRQDAGDQGLHDQRRQPGDYAEPAGPASLAYEGHGNLTSDGATGFAYDLVRLFGAGPDRRSKRPYRPPSQAEPVFDTTYSRFNASGIETHSLRAEQAFGWLGKKGKAAGPPCGDDGRSAARCGTYAARPPHSRVTPKR